MAERAPATTGVALLSGGLDSGVAAACHLAAGGTIAACLFFDYGQRAARPELNSARALARRLGAPLVTIELPWLGVLARRAGSRLVADGDLPRGTVERPGDEASARAVWVPARNAVFVAIAAAHAEADGAQCIVAGFNREEAATFPDNSAAFLSRATAFLQLGTRNAVVVFSPTIDWDKVQIVAEARALGFGPGDFWSCYEGGEAPCGTCESCLRSRWPR
jgi:7-cyano-7-deazaguanine synthase